MLNSPTSTSIIPRPLYAGSESVSLILPTITVTCPSEENLARHVSSFTSTTKVSSSSTADSDPGVIMAFSSISKKKNHISSKHPQGLSPLLRLPAELRQQIVAEILPAKEVISYKCPLGALRIDKKSVHMISDSRGIHRHRGCGSGPGWSCMHYHVGRRLDIMRVCKLLYEDCLEVLYALGTFELEIHSTPWACNAGVWAASLGASWSMSLKDPNWYSSPQTYCKAPTKYKNDNDREAFARLPWGRMKCVRFLIDGNILLHCTSEKPLARNSPINTLSGALEWVCGVLAVVEGGVRRIELLFCLDESLLRGRSGMNQQYLRLILAPIACLQGTIGTWGVGLNLALDGGILDFRSEVHEGTEEVACSEGNNPKRLDASSKFRVQSRDMSSTALTVETVMGELLDMFSVEEKAEHGKRIKAEKK